MDKVNTGQLDDLYGMLTYDLKSLPYSMGLTDLYKIKEGSNIVIYDSSMGSRPLLFNKNSNIKIIDIANNDKIRKIKELETSLKYLQDRYEKLSTRKGFIQYKIEIAKLKGDLFSIRSLFSIRRLLRDLRFWLFASKEDRQLRKIINKIEDVILD